MRNILVRQIHFSAPLRGVTWEVRNITSDTPQAKPAPRSPSKRPEAAIPPPTASSPPTASPPPPASADENHADENNLRELFASILDAVQRLEENQRRALGELQQVAVELSVAIAAHLVKQKIDAGEAGIENLVQEAISRLGSPQPVVVHIHPQDQKTFGEGWQDELALSSQQITLVADENLPRGACRVTAGDFGLLSTMEQRLATIRNELLQGIEYAQIERRKDGTDGGSLRRFPDRRQTA